MSLISSSQCGGYKTSLNKQNNIKNNIRRAFVKVIFLSFSIEFIMTKAEFLFAAVDKLKFWQIL